MVSILIFTGSIFLLMQKLTWRNLSDEFQSLFLLDQYFYLVTTGNTTQLKGVSILIFTGSIFLFF